MKNELKEINRRIEEIRTAVTAGNVSEELSKELDTLLEKRSELEKRQQDMQRRFPNLPQVEQKTNEELAEERMVQKKSYRSAWLKELAGHPLSNSERELLEEQRAVTSASGSGGAAIPTITYQKIQDLMEQTSVLYPRVTKSYIKGILKLPVEDSTTDAAWVAEGAGAADGTDKLKEVTFQAYDLIKNQAITAQVSTMSIDDFESWLVRVFARKMAKALDKAILLGAGSLSNQPTGIEGTTFVEGTNLITTASATAVTYDEVVNFLGLLKTVYSQNAELIMSRTFLFSYLYKIKDDNKMPIFIMDREKGNAGKILGVPVTIFDQCPNDVVYYGDLSHYQFNFNKDVEITKDTSVGFKKATTDYRAHALVDGKLTVSDAWVKLKLKAGT